MKKKSNRFLSFCLAAVLFSGIFTVLPEPVAVHAETLKSSNKNKILELDEQAPDGLATAKNPYGYEAGIAFPLSKGHEILYYGGWDGKTERKFLNGSSISGLNDFVDAPNKKTNSEAKVPGGVWNWIQTVAFDNDANSTKEDKILFVAVGKNHYAYAWVLDYSTNTLSNTVELGNMSWIGDDYDQYSSTSLLEVTAGDFDGDGVDSLMVYTPLNLNSSEGTGCVLHELTYSGNNLQKSYSVNSLLMDQYVTDQNSRKYTDKSDTDDTCRDKLAVSMQVGDYNGDSIDDLAVLSYSHYRYSAGNTAYYSPQLKMCYGNKEFKNFSNKKADETFTVASTSGSTLTFPVGVSLAAGDYNGDGYDDLYAVGVKSTASTGNISSISVDGANWYLHRFNGTLDSKMVNAGYTTTASNEWFEDGFYKDDYCYGETLATGVAMSGNTAPEVLFIAGSIYDVSTGMPIHKLTGSYFNDSDNGASSAAITNTYMQSVQVGNFDNNSAGREQVVYIVGLKQSGQDDYYFEAGTAYGTNFSDTTYADGSTCYGTATSYYCTDLDDSEYIHNDKGDDTDEGLNCFFVAMDCDDDALEAKYLGVNYAYTDPVVNAVLQAAPYFGDDSKGSGLNTTTYTLRTTYATADTDSDSVSLSAGVAASGSVPFAETTNVAIGLRGGVCSAYTDTYESSYSDSFEAGAHNVVVVNRTPMLIYRFDVKTDNQWTDKVQMEMAVPEEPVYTLLTVDEYNEFANTYNQMMESKAADYNPLTQIDLKENWMDNNEGNPYGYNQSGWSDTSIEAKKISKGNGYELGTTGGRTVVTFEDGNSSTTELTWDIGFYTTMSVLFGPKAIANFGFEFHGEYAHGFGEATTTGDMVGTSYAVQDLDGEAMLKAGMDQDVLDLYGFTWTCGTWKRHLGNLDGDGNKVKTLFLGYALDNISSPPIKVSDLKVDKADETGIALSWSKPETPKGWPSIDGYILYQGFVDKNGDVKFEALEEIKGADKIETIVDELLDGSGIYPDTEYLFMIRSYHKTDSAAAYSDKSNVVTVRTSEKSYAVNIEYDEDATEVTVTQQNGKKVSDGDRLPAGTIMKIQAEAKENYLLQKIVITDEASGKTTEIEAGDDGTTAIGYYQVNGDTKVSFKTKKIIKESTVTYDKSISDKDGNTVGTVSATVGDVPISSGAVVSEPVTFTAQAAEGYVLTGWDVTIDGQAYNYATNHQTEITIGLLGEEIDVKARFELMASVTEVITVIQPEEGGDITLLNASGEELLPCEDGDYHVAYGEEVTFKANPRTGYVIKAWTGDAAEKTGDSFTMSITKDVTIGIVYNAPVKYRLTYTVEDESDNYLTVEPYVKSGTTLAAGTKVTFSAVAADGHRIDKWTITKGGNAEEIIPEDGCCIADRQEVTIDANTVVDVSFVEIEQHDIQVEQTGEGNVMIISGNKLLANGDKVEHANNVVLSARPAKGWRLSNPEEWTEVADGSYRKIFTNITSAQKFLVTFEKVEVPENPDDDENQEGGTVIPDGGNQNDDTNTSENGYQNDDIKDSKNETNASSDSKDKNSPDTGDAAGIEIIALGMSLFVLLLITGIRLRRKG